MTAVGFIKKRKREETLTAFLGLAVLLCVFSSDALKGAVKGLELCFLHILPSTFPFMVISSIISSCLTGNRGKLLSSVFIGNLSGYPVGGKLCGELINSDTSFIEALLTLTCCIGAGPGFTVGAVGTGILRSTQMGLLLFSSQVLTSLTAFILLLFVRKRRTESAHKQREFIFSKVLTDAVREGCSASLTICGFVVLFSCLLGIFENILSSLDGGLGMLICGFLEVSSGCARASFDMSPFGFAMLGAILGFGGLSVFCQLTAITLSSKLSTRTLFLSRMLSGALGGFYTLLLFSFFKDSIETMAFDSGLHSVTHNPLPLAFCLCLLFGVLLICDKKTAEINFRLKNVKSNL